MKTDLFTKGQQVDAPDSGQTVFFEDHILPRSVTTRVKEASSSIIDTITDCDGLNRKIQSVSLGEGGQSIVNRWIDTNYLDPFFIFMYKFKLVSVKYLYPPIFMTITQH